MWRHEQDLPNSHLLLDLRLKPLVEEMARMEIQERHSLPLACHDLFVSAFSTASGFLSITVK